MNARMPWVKLTLQGILLLSFLLTLAGCGDNDPVASNERGDEGIIPPEEDQTLEDQLDIVIRIQDFGGTVEEGFELAIRLETADGSTIESFLWSDLVGDGGGGASYDAVYSRAVARGGVVLRAEVSLGDGGSPAELDPAGELACVLELTPHIDDSTIVVEVSLLDEADCLHQVGR